MAPTIVIIKARHGLREDFDLAAGRGEGVLIGGAAEFFQHKFGSGQLVAKMYLLTLPECLEIGQYNAPLGGIGDCLVIEMFHPGFFAATLSECLTKS